MGEVFFLLFLLIVLLNSFRILKEYERGVVFLLGRFYKVKGPGLIVIVFGMKQSGSHPGVDEPSAL